MNTFIKILFMIGLLSIQQTVKSQSNDSLDFYLKIAAENNPGLKSEYLKYRASLEKAVPAGTLPDPQFEFGFFLQPMELVMGNQIANFKLMQMFPWFGTLKAAEDEASKMTVVNFQSFQNSKNELFYQVKSSYYNLYLLQQEIKITEESLKILRSVEQLVLIKYQSNSGKGSATSPMPSSKENVNMENGGMGNSSTNDKVNSSATTSPSMPASGENKMLNLFRIQMELNTLENNLNLLQSKLKTGCLSFNRYLNRPSEYVFIGDTLIPPTLPFNLNSLSDSLINNPMVKMLQADSAVYDSRIRMIRKMNFPMIGVGVNYMLINRLHHSNVETGKDMIMPMVTATLPIYRKKYSALEREAQLLRSASNNASQNTINNLNVEFEQTIQQWNDANRRVILYTKQARLADESMSILLTSFSTNGSDFEEILRMQQQLLDFQFKKIEAITDQNIAAASILFLTGQQ